MTAKRRVSSAASPEGPAKTQKRRRVSTYVPETSETAEGTSNAALKLLDQIKEATDKYGRLVATEFLTLPDKDENPEYYKIIRLPLSLDMIEERLKNHEYTSMTPVESDLRRMVSNAKFYNEKSSLVFSNAERIRKMIVAGMPKINPAYKDPNYAPFSTPVPESEGDDSMEPAEEAADEPTEPEPELEPEAEERPKSRSRTANRASTTDRDVDTIASSDDSFEGLSFEAAQEKIISKMIRVKDEDGEEVFGPFINKPDRNLYKEYYDVIEHPVSLRTILKLVRGTDRRKNSTQKSPFRTWQSFEDEMSYIWKNARVFNEEDSEIYRQAGELEDYFYERLKEARHVVPEPPSAADDSGRTRIKLKMGGTQTPEPSSQKVKLKLSGRSDDGAAGRHDDGVGVDSEALRRQQALVHAGTNGTEGSKQSASTPSRSLRDRSGSGARPTSRRTQDRDVQQPANGQPPKAEPSTVKPEGSSRQTPNIETAGGQSQINGVATPSESNLLKGVAEYVNSHDTGPEEASDTANRSEQDSPAPRQKVRRPPRDILHALIRNVNITTNPVLHLPQPFHLDIPPSTSSPVQSVTINLPPTHHILSIHPTFAASSLQTQTQLSVSVGNQKLLPSSSAHSQVPDAMTQRFDVRLGPGITKIDVEMMAAPARGLAHLSVNRDSGVEYERATIFANLMRA